MKRPIAPGLLMGSKQHVAKPGGRAAVPEEVRAAQGERLLTLRKHLGLTQEQLAEVAGYNRSDFSRFEKGGRLSSAEVRDRLALAFGISVEAFKRFLLAGGVATLEELDEMARARAGSVAGRSTVEPLDIERILAIAEKLGRSAADVRQVRDTAARSGTITDEEIAGLFRALDAKPEKVAGHRVIVTEDDLFGGSAAIPKLPPRKGRRR